MADATTAARAGWWSQLMRARPAKPGEIYGVPGQGDSVGISAAVIAALVFVWWLVTQAGWIKPLFLPSPGEVINAFLDVLQSGTNDLALEFVDGIGERFLLAQDLLLNR